MNWSDAVCFSEASLLFECEEHVRLHGGTLTEGEECTVLTAVGSSIKPRGEADDATAAHRTSSPSVSVPLPITARGKAPAWTPPRRPQEAPRRLATERLKELLG